MSTAITSGTLPGHQTLLERLVPGTVDRSKWLRDAVTVIVGSILLTLSAKISFPFVPVPLSLQTLVVLCMGMALGPRLAAVTVIAYLAQGAAGLPVFAGTPEKGLGLAYMMGPTGGYLLGFILAATTTGFLARLGWDRNVWLTVAAMFVGSALIYLPGVLWLGTVVGWDKPVLAWGMTPFLLGDLAKIVVGAALMPSLWKLLGQGELRG